MTIDTSAMLFEVEFIAANTKCANCGHCGMTIAGGDIPMRLSSHAFECQPLVQCLRCHVAASLPITFAKHEAKFIV